MSKQTEPSMSAAPLIVTNVTKQFGAQTAVSNVSFTVQPGEVFGIIGPNGAGKSTTIKMILGLTPVTSGTISLFDQTIAQDNVRQRIGYMPETPSFYSHLTGRELLVLAGELFGMTKAAIAKRSDELLELLDLVDAANRPLNGYSKGMLQRIGLAQALINSPELVFLDEPMDGLDPIGRIAMRKILETIKSSGTSIVFNSHILSDVALISDRIAIMDHGVVLAIGSVNALVPKNKTLEEVFIATITENTHVA
jgi:ABC-2 type transport system ATP-binding protein